MLSRTYRLGSSAGHGETSPATDRPRSMSQRGKSPASPRRFTAQAPSRRRRRARRDHRDRRGARLQSIHETQNVGNIIEDANKFLFCDTNVLITKAWSETHFNGYCAPEIQYWVDTFKYDHYFLTDIDVPWQADDLRDRPDSRKQMFDYFENLLKIF